MSASRNETTLIFPIDRRITLEITAGKTVTLEPWDLAVLSQGAGRISRLESAKSAVSTSVSWRGWTSVFRGDARILVGREQQAGLGVGDSVDQPNAPQHPVNRLEAVGAQFGDDVPAPVGGVQGADRGIAAQRPDHFVGAIALDGHHREGANPLILPLAA